MKDLNDLEASRKNERLDTIRIDLNDPNQLKELDSLHYQLESPL